METKAQPIPDFASRIGEHLRSDDDPDLWQTAMERIVADAELVCDRYRGKSEIFVQVGSCSHWMSPHNKGSWFPDVRFAWPTGYGSTGFRIYGLPEFDWFLAWKRVLREKSYWDPVQRIHGRRSLVLRVALPARTAKHVRAVAHALWIPGSPTCPKGQFLQGYAFAKEKGRWSWVATSGEQTPYE